MSLRDLDYPPPQELVREMDCVLRNRIADYLEQGDVYEVYRGISWCRFSCDRQMGNREFADGYWVWPEDLGNYVRQHDVILPEELISHITGEIPRLPRSDWSSVADDSFWKEWCRVTATGKLHGRISEAKRLADEGAKTVLAKLVADSEQREGLSDERCHFLGCSNRAVAGRQLCAACCIRGGQDEALCAQFYSDILPVILGG